MLCFQLHLQITDDEMSLQSAVFFKSCLLKRFRKLPVFFHSVFLRLARSVSLSEFNAKRTIKKHKCFNALTIELIGSTWFRRRFVQFR